MNTPLIEARDLSVHHGGTPVLSHVDLQLHAGEIVTIVGPNGSGKSTLVRALIGLEHPATGQVSRRAGLRLGYVPQRLHIDSAMPMPVRRFLSLPRRVDPARARAALERVGLGDVMARPMTRLSGGQFQRVLLARALLTDPEVLILDEPTQGLDQPGISAFYRLLEEVRVDTGAAVLLVSHDLLVVMSASDRVICLNGHVCCQGSPEVVSEAPEYHALFGQDSEGTLALYRHAHDHDHDGECDHGHGHTHGGHDRDLRADQHGGAGTGGVQPAEGRARTGRARHA